MNLQSPPKVLFLTHVGEPGGAEYALMSLCAGLKADGSFQPEVLLLDSGSLKESITAIDVPCGELKPSSSLHTIRREDGALASVRALPGIILILTRLLRIVKHYDVLIPVSQKSFMLLALMRPLLRKPIIWYMNDLITTEHFSASMIRLMVIAANRCADQVIVNSEASLRAWTNAGGNVKNASISYSGIDIQAFDSAVGTQAQVQALRATLGRADRPVVAMIGRISPWKGQHVFLQALAEIPEAIGIIVGDALFGEHDYEVSLRQYVETNGLQHRVSFLGHRSDVPRLLAAADLVVHCSTAPEPFGRVIVEAMLAGTPVIAADSGGPREIIEAGKTGTLVAPGKPELLQAAMEAYLHNPDLRQRTAREARHHSEQRYSCTTMVQSLLACLRSMRIASP